MRARRTRRARRGARRAPAARSTAGSQRCSRSASSRPAPGAVSTARALAWCVWAACPYALRRATTAVAGAREAPRPDEGDRAPRAAARQPGRLHRAAAGCEHPRARDQARRRPATPRRRLPSGAARLRAGQLLRDEYFTETVIEAPTKVGARDRGRGPRVAGRDRRTGVSISDGDVVPGVATVGAPASLPGCDPRRDRLQPSTG